MSEMLKKAIDEDVKNMIPIIRSYITDDNLNDINNSDIYFSENVNFLVKKDILDKIEEVSSFLLIHYGPTTPDYFRNAAKYCHFLSIIFHLYFPDFTLIQGYPVYRRGYRHTWLQKGDIVFDPALKIILSTQEYYAHFNKALESTKNETIELMSNHYDIFDYFPNPLYPLKNNSAKVQDLLGKITSYQKQSGGVIIKY